MTSKGRKLVNALIGLLLVVVFLACVASVVMFITVRLSLPVIDGQVMISGPKQSIRIMRDARGVPTIQAECRDDLAFGLGSFMDRIGTSRWTAFADMRPGSFPRYLVPARTRSASSGIARSEFSGFVRWRRKLWRALGGTSVASSMPT